MALPCGLTSTTSSYQDAIRGRFTDQVGDIYPLADPITDQHHKDDVAWTTRSDRLPRRNNDRREERCHDDRYRRHDDRLESLRAGQFRRRRPDNVIRRRSDILTKAKYLYYICI